MHAKRFDPEWVLSVIHGKFKPILSKTMLNPVTTFYIQKKWTFIMKGSCNYTEHAATNN